MARVNVIMPESLMHSLTGRSDAVRGLSETVRESLDRYFVILEVARRQIKDKFTGAELSLLVDICNGTAFTSAGLVGSLAADAEDAEGTYYEKWQVDRKALLSKLKSLSPCQEAALIDAIERFWQAVSRDMTVDPKTILG